MTTLTIKQLQDYLSLKYKDRSDITGLFMKLVEEIGEVAEAMNQKDGRKTNDGSSSLAIELADMIHYIFAIASIADINLTEVILEKDKVASVKYQQVPNLLAFITEDKEMV